MIKYIYLFEYLIDVKNGRGYFILDIWIVCFNCYYCLGRNIGKYGSNGNYYEYYCELMNSFFLFIGVRII